MKDAAIVAPPATAVASVHPVNAVEVFPVQITGLACPLTFKPTPPLIASSVGIADTLMLPLLKLPVAVGADAMGPTERAIGDSWIPGVPRGETANQSSDTGATPCDFGKN